MELGKLAVVQTGGKQYVVRERDTLRVEKLGGKEGDKVALNTVLLTANGGNVTIGTPNVEKASVSAEIIEQGREDKVTILKFKNKIRYSGKRGHRQPFTKLQITSIK